MIAWHFSIQATAHNIAREQVQTWLKQMGATAETVDFRMLRGALTINNIKASYQDSPLFIEQVLIKGNPASIATDKPVIQKVLIQHISIDAYGASQSWQDLNYALSPSLKSIFYFAKHIHVQGGSIQHLATLPNITINDIHVSNMSATRKILGDGYIGAPKNHWEMESLFPTDISQQTGSISSAYQNIQSDINWSGAWASKNLNAYIQQQTTQPLANLDLHVRQQEQQWSVDFNALSWRVHTPFLSTSVTGQGHITGTPNDWVITSKKMQWQATKVPSHQITIANVTSDNLKIHSKDQIIHITNLDLDNPSMSIDTSQDTSLKLPWQTNIQNINIKKLNASIMVHQNPVKIPELDGTAKVQKSNIQFDLSSQSLRDEFWHVQSKNDNEVYLTVSNTPLAQLRNLLPDPIRQQALILEGSASLKLTMQPEQAWLTTGEAKVSDIHLASKNQTFKATKLQLAILNASTSGLHQATLYADGWLMQFPLTPRQAWTEKSHLNEWVRIPWTFNNISLTHGEVALGNENQVWIQDATLSIQRWQSQKPAKLEFQGLFGMSPVIIDAQLISDEQQIMQWNSLNLRTPYADLSALSEWLKISDLPLIEKGHMNLNLSASRDDKGIQGITHLGFTQLSTIETTNDLLQQVSGVSSQGIIKQLNQKHKVQLNTSFQGNASDDWTILAGQSLLKNMLSKLEKATTPSNTIVTRTKFLGSIRLHQGNGLSQNERSRLRKLIINARSNRGWHVELKPDLGTAEFTPAIQDQITQTQSLIKTFMSTRGIATKNIYLILPQEKHQSTSSAGAIHINLVK